MFGLKCFAQLRTYRVLVSILIYNIWSVLLKESVCRLSHVLESIAVISNKGAHRQGLFFSVK